MTIALRYAARSDVGLIREGNEDAGYAGPHLLAIADGMGGHAAGEVASSITVSTICELDEADPTARGTRGSIDEANLQLRQMIEGDDALEVWAPPSPLLFAGSRVGIAHIGDSRAFLLRGASSRRSRMTTPSCRRWSTRAASVPTRPSTTRSGRC